MIQSNMHCGTCHAQSALTLLKNTNAVSRSCKVEVRGQVGRPDIVSILMKIFPYLFKYAPSLCLRHFIISDRYGRERES